MHVFGEVLKEVLITGRKGDFVGGRVDISKGSKKMVEKGTGAYAGHRDAALVIPVSGSHDVIGQTQAIES